AQCSQPQRPNLLCVFPPENAVCFKPVKFVQHDTANRSSIGRTGNYWCLSAAQLSSDRSRGLKLQHETSVFRHHVIMHFTLSSVFRAAFWAVLWCDRAG
ncbi:hypothetical protein BaRGS_00026475, partial [Batillaria attramentaria]